MRWLYCLILILLPLSAHAACEGRDLRLELSETESAELDAAVGEIVFPEGNHWTATKGDTKLHLIGTLHTNDERMSAVVERLSPTLAEADAFYFEITEADLKVFEEELVKDFSPVLITTGPTLVDLLSEEQWAELSATLTERGIASWMAAKMRPWFISMMLSMPPCMLQTPNADYGMDKRLTEVANALGAPQHSLETIDELIAIFDSHPIEKQAQSLIRLAGALQGGDDQLATMSNAYMEEKHAQIFQLSRFLGLRDSGLSPEEFDAEWSSFEEQMLVLRNNNWMRQILEIEDKTAVIAVGAGHLAGEHGLLNQLQNEGYTLTRAKF